MSTATQPQVALTPDSPAPTPLQRVLLTFTAPSRAFAHLGSGSSWWLPYLLILVTGLSFATIVGSKVGWDTVARNNLATSPKQEARFEQVPAAQQRQQIALIARVTSISSYAAAVLAPLVIGAMISGILLATLNFALGGSARFGPLFAVYIFSTLPQALKSLITIATLFLGSNSDSFQLNSPLGSNPSYYMQGSGTPLWVTSLISWLDLFLIWQLVVLAIGCSVVASISRGKAFTAVLGWAVVVALVGAAVAAFA